MSKMTTLRNSSRSLEPSLKIKKEFLLDCTSKNSELPNYDSGRDKNLYSFLHNNNIKQQMIFKGIMNDDGTLKKEKDIKFIDRSTSQSKLNNGVRMENLINSKAQLEVREKILKKFEIPILLKKKMDKNKKTKEEILNLNPVSKEELNKILNDYKSNILNAQKK